MKPAITDRYARSPDPDIYALADCNNEAADDLAKCRYPRAIVLFSQASTSCHEALGSDHAATLTVAGNLGVALVKSGHHSDGISAAGVAGVGKFD